MLESLYKICLVISKGYMIVGDRHTDQEEIV